MTEQKDALSAALAAASQAARAVGRLQIMCGDGDASDAELNDAEHAEKYARAAVERLARPAAPAEAQPVALHIIRAWPEGFAARLEHVWRDLVGFVPNYKLYDLHRVLAEFGFTMLVYEGAAPAQPVAQPQAQTLTNRELELIDGMIAVQLDHAARCDSMLNREMAERQKSWDMERVALLRKLKSVAGEANDHQP